MKLVNVNPGETVQLFATRWGRTVQQIIDENPDNAALDMMSKRAGKFAILVPRGITQLNVPDDAVEVGGVVVAVDPGPGPTPEPLLGLTNDARNWLTYEAIFNQRLYRKTNQRLQLGLYRIPLNHVKIFVRDGIADATLKQLVAAFFPDLKVELVERLSLETWKWKTAPSKLESAYLPRSPQKVTANRSVNVYYAKQYAVLPFNFEDNGDGTHAIGHAEETEGGAKLQKLKKTWGFWKTASRSIVVDLKPVKEADKPWAGLLDPDFQWTLAQMPAKPDNPALGAAERAKDLRSENAKGTALSISDASVAVCGLKTGVQYVGWVNQQAQHKDKLEENSVIACLRSDLVVEMDRRAGRARPQLDPDMILQTELLSITEIDQPDVANRNDKWEFGDGVQVRDFTVLDRSKLYFPPISIPFVDRNLVDLKRRFECVGDAVWRNFWKGAYAERLGKAKAILLLRYGLQMGSPNAQNFLLEFSPAAGMAAPAPTGRVVLRDLGDMYLHREVLWARLGGSGLPPQAVDRKTDLKTLKSKLIQFECTTLTQGSAAEDWREYVPYETGSVYEASYGPRGTRFSWHRFSTLAKGANVYAASVTGTDPDAYSNAWREACAAMCEWGVAHDRAYVSYIEDTLQTVLSTAGPAAPDALGIINWANAPDATRYRNAVPSDKESADAFWKQDRDWEDAQADKVHRFLASKDGQDKLRAL